MEPCGLRIGATGKNRTPDVLIRNAVPAEALRSPVSFSAGPPERLGFGWFRESGVPASRMSLVPTTTLKETGLVTRRPLTTGTRMR